MEVSLSNQIKFIQILRTNFVKVAPEGTSFIQKRRTLERKVSARFDVHATITERAYSILKAVLKLMFFKITQVLVQLGIRLYTYDILTVEKTIWGQPNKSQNVTKKQAITFTIPKFLIQIIPFYCSREEKNCKKYALY